MLPLGSVNESEELNWLLRWSESDHFHLFGRVRFFLFPGRALTLKRIVCRAELQGKRKLWRGWLTRLHVEIPNRCCPGAVTGYFIPAFLLLGWNCGTHCYRRRRDRSIALQSKHVRGKARGIGSTHKSPFLPLSSGPGQGALPQHGKGRVTWTDRWDAGMVFISTQVPISPQMFHSCIVVQISWFIIAAWCYIARCYIARCYIYTGFIYAS